MIIRSLEARDLDAVKQIHEKFYADEFKLPDFINKFICAFAVVEDDKIIVAGGVRSIAESVIITNKDIDFNKKLQALEHTLSASKWIAQRAGYTQIHAFVQDSNWEKYLTKAGFGLVKGSVLVFPGENNGQG